MSSRGEEDKMVDELMSDEGTVRKITALLALRRERHRNSLEDGEDPKTQGRALECRDLIKVFTQ